MDESEKPPIAKEMEALWGEPGQVLIYSYRPGGGVMRPPGHIDVIFGEEVKVRDVLLLCLHRLTSIQRANPTPLGGIELLVLIRLLGMKKD